MESKHVSFSRQISQADSGYICLLSSCVFRRLEAVKHLATAGSQKILLTSDDYGFSLQSYNEH